MRTDKGFTTEGCFTEQNRFQILFETPKKNFNLEKGKRSHRQPKSIFLAEKLTSRALKGQRGSLPVTPLGYLKFTKVIFRTMRTMRKQFPVNWLTSGRFSGVNK